MRECTIGTYEWCSNFTLEQHWKLQRRGEVYVQRGLRAPVRRCCSHFVVSGRRNVVGHSDAGVRRRCVQRACGSNGWKRSNAVRHEQPRLDRNVCVRCYVLSVLQHRADLCADGSLIERRMVWRSADVQQSPVSCAGAANEWWGDCVLFKSRRGLDCNLYMRRAIHAVLRSGARVQSDGNERCWYVERF